jgi:hypothetical protein
MALSLDSKARKNRGVRTDVWEPVVEEGKEEAEPFLPPKLLCKVEECEHEMSAREGNVSKMLSTSAISAYQKLSLL